jgi:hypothetical protein
MEGEWVSLQRLRDQKVRVLSTERRTAVAPQLDDHQGLGRSPGLDFAESAAESQAPEPIQEIETNWYFDRIAGVFGLRSR